MERRSRPQVKEPPLDEIAEAKYSKQYIEELFKLHPDAELLARMWEIDPKTMNGLMPEVGEQGEPEKTWMQDEIHLTINSLRKAAGLEPRRIVTPEQRMYEAWQGLSEEEKAEVYVPTSRRDNWEAGAILAEPDVYFTAARYVIGQQVEAEMAEERRRGLG